MLLPFYLWSVWHCLQLVCWSWRWVLSQEVPQTSVLSQEVLIDFWWAHLIVDQTLSWPKPGSKHGWLRLKARTSSMQNTHTHTHTHSLSLCHTYKHKCPHAYTYMNSNMCTWTDRHHITFKHYCFHFFCSTNSYWASTLCLTLSGTKTGVVNEASKFLAFVELTVYGINRQ